MLFLLLSLVFSTPVDICKVTPTPYESAPVDYKLKYVQLIARHGDRTPSNSYKGDNGKFTCGYVEESHIYQETSGKVSHTATSKTSLIDKKKNPYAINYMWEGSCEPGQLTPEGISMHYKLGAHVRELYKSILPEVFDPELIHLRSSGKIRTLQSMEAFLQRFYPIKERGKYTDLEILTRPYEIESLKPNKDCCPIIKTLDTATAQSEEVINLRSNENVTKAYNKIKRVTGIADATGDLYDYVDMMAARVCHNEKYPCNDNECLDESDYETILDEYLIENKYFYAAGSAKYKLGFFVDEMLADAESALNGKVVYQHYSAHDSSIYGILGLLGEDTTQPIPYASTLAFEYLTKDGVNYVRALLNDKVLPLRLCAKENNICTFEEFETKLKAQVPQYSECGNTLSQRPISRKGWYTRN
ncbi:hypothetical protein EIN_046450 [Entamoeba invadens IP1]|uniref:Acid phosphatase n=1 Tax=Entamoeba invadens IP1 TaxID=370355 RepID=A0A0A1UG45_ENTIV|nr:hypothetical protein EIN_046450 [Entamoeba invadens IP1]ELP94402.1 hypothetical protein EIN_046450 [Entamoeba invadens IP1]|eukprot:XP_004261173.1 hypothetical protein EIN_046450 [Entamoeba invadens IP1]